MTDKKNYHKSIEVRLWKYCTQVRDLKENPEEVIGEEVANVLLCRDELELLQVVGDPYYEKYRKKVSEADKTLKELLSTKDTELLKLRLKNIYRYLSLAEGKEGWWWHPEKINPEALKYLPPDWLKDCD